MRQGSVLEQTFLRVVLILGITALSMFSATYGLQRQWQMAALEGLGACVLVGALIWQKLGGTVGPAILGWVGIYSVFAVLLFTGGIGGTGIIWWSVMPVIGYVLFGAIGGSVSLGLTLLTIGAAWIFARLGIGHIYFDEIFIRQTFFMLVVEGIVLYFFVATLNQTKKIVAVQSRQLEKEIESKKLVEAQLTQKVAELSIQQQKQGQIRTAMINLLEDEKELELALSKEKEGVVKQVEARTGELTAIIDSINRALLVVDEKREIVLKNKMVDELIAGNKDTLYQDVVHFLKTQMDLEKMVTQCFVQQSEVAEEPQLFGNRYLRVQVVPVVQESGIKSVAIFIKDVTEEMAVTRSRDEFFSIASHELRTPLTAIRGNSEMIMDQFGDKIKDKEMHEMLEDIHTGSVRLIEIVNDFLNLSRLELGKIDFKIEKLDLKNIADEVVKESGVLASDKNIAIELVLPKQALPNVLGDGDRVKQVLFNVVGNALKFCKKGKIVVGVEVGEAEVQVNITDSGEGIAKEVQGLLFHKFQQAGTSLYTRDTSRGTGLGLYISRLMMEGMGGKIWLKASEVGVGSTFTFSLPIAKDLEK